MIREWIETLKMKIRKYRAFHDEKKAEYMKKYDEMMEERKKRKKGGKK